MLFLEVWVVWKNSSSLRAEGSGFCLLRTMSRPVPEWGKWTRVSLALCLQEGSSRRWLLPRCSLWHCSRVSPRGFFTATQAQHPSLFSCHLCPCTIRDICYVLGTVMPLGTKEWPQTLSWRASKQEESQSVTGRRVWECPRGERENLFKGRRWLGKACSLGNWCTIWEKRKSHVWQMCVYKCDFCTRVTLLLLHVCKR